MPPLPENEFTLLKLTHVAAGQFGMTLQVASLPGMWHDTIANMLLAGRKP